MVVDIDCHHADGTQDAFYSESGVLTVSLHEDGTYLFSGSGFVFEDVKRVVQEVKERIFPVHGLEP